MKRFITLLMLLALTSVTLAEGGLTLPEDCRQLVVVTGSTWNATTARLQRFERDDKDSPWEKYGTAIEVNLGRSGMAWGESPLMNGFIPPKADKQKREGDGRSPAGLFPLLSAFGHPAPPKGYTDRNLPFLTVTDEQAVDDVDSPHYNKIVKPSEVGGVTWKSAETMKIDLYKLGLVVGHNYPNPKPGYGSCIFFHYQAGPGKPTAGCTSMVAKELRALAIWLKRDRNPCLIQLPSSEYAKLGSSFPSIKQ